MVTAGNYSGRVINCGTDHMGRWCYQYLACKDNRNLEEISAYQPCQQQIRYQTRVKTITVTAQQQRMLEMENRYINTRKAFNFDLDKSFEAIYNKGDGVLLIGYFNKCINNRNGGIRKLQHANKLQDLM